MEAPVKSRLKRVSPHRVRVASISKLNFLTAKFKNKARRVHRIINPSLPCLLSPPRPQSPPMGRGESSQEKSRSSTLMKTIISLIKTSKRKKKTLAKTLAFLGSQLRHFMALRDALLKDKKRPVSKTQFQIQKEFGSSLRAVRRVLTISKGAGPKKSISDFWELSSCSEKNGERYSSTWERGLALKLAPMPRNSL